MRENDLPMKEIMAGLRTMIELKLAEPGLTKEQYTVLKETDTEINDIAKQTWNVEDLTELNTRLEVVTKNLEKVKDL